MGLAVLLKETGIIESTIVWGGDWNRDFILHDQAFMDYVHFQIA